MLREPKDEDVAEAAQGKSPEKDEYANKKRRHGNRIAREAT